MTSHTATVGTEHAAFLAQPEYDGAFTDLGNGRVAIDMQRAGMLDSEVDGSLADGQVWIGGIGYPISTDESLVVRPAYSYSDDAWRVEIALDDPDVQDVREVVEVDGGEELTAVTLAKTIAHERGLRYDYVDA